MPSLALLVQLAYQRRCPEAARLARRALTAGTSLTYGGPAGLQEL